VTDKGQRIPAGHQEAEHLEKTPPAVGEGSTPDIPEEIPERHNIKEVRHLMHIQTLRFAVYLKGQSLAGQHDAEKDRHKKPHDVESSLAHQFLSEMRFTAQLLLAS
jgi:hypothetical protein